MNQVIAQGLPISAALGILALAFALVLGLAAGIVSAVVSRFGRRCGADVDGHGRHRAAEFRDRQSGDHAVRVHDSDLSRRRLGIVATTGAAGDLPRRRSTRPRSPASRGPACSTCCRRITFAPPGPRGSARRPSCLRHALPGALLPVVSFLGPATAGILTGSVVIEKIFAIPGLGWHFVQAALQRDYTLDDGLVLLYTVMLFTMNFLVDLSYRVLDPRVELN